jgi:hypothetical protein
MHQRMGSGVGEIYRIQQLGESPTSGSCDSWQHLPGDGPGHHKHRKPHSSRITGKVMFHSESVR